MPAKKYYTYVLLCADQTMYCGFTDDVTKRLATHNAGKGAKYTKGRRPVQLLNAVEFDDKSSATRCEWWFKHKLTRTQKLKFISENTIKEHYQVYQSKQAK